VLEVVLEASYFLGTFRSIAAQAVGRGVLWACPVLVFRAVVWLQWVKSHIAFFDSREFLRDQEMSSAAEARG